MYSDEDPNIDIELMIDPDDDCDIEPAWMWDAPEDEDHPDGGYATIDEMIEAMAWSDPARIRLLAKARAERIRLYRDPADGRHYASSTSQPGKLHYLTAYSCSCQGFVRHQRCKHHSALLSVLGWLGTDPEPTSSAIAA